MWPKRPAPASGAKQPFYHATGNSAAFIPLVAFHLSERGVTMFSMSCLRALRPERLI